MDDAVEAPEDLAIGVLAVGPVEELEGHDLSRGRDVAVVPEGPGGGRCGSRWRCRWRGGGPWGRRGAGGPGVDAELPERVAVAGAADGPVHPDVAAATTDGEGLDATGAGGGGVDRRPVGGVRRGLDLERLSIGGFPVQDHLADRLGRTEVDLEPLRVAGQA